MDRDSDVSFDEHSEQVDLAHVIAEFPEGDDQPGANIPIKKLSEVFESCISQEEGAASTDADGVKVIVNPIAGGNDGMRVYLRIRPTGNGSDTNTTIRVESDSSIITTAPETSKRAQYTKMEERHYTFSRVYGTQASQNEVFEHTVEPMLSRFVSGESCVLFAYGMTNAGKTHTIQGTAQNPGILPRLVSAAFDRLSAGSSARSGQWEMQTSMLEIYQEKIYDLLDKKVVREKLNIRDGNGRVEVCKLSSHPVASSQDALKLMDSAAMRRTKSKTLLNSGSSRSHAIYSITLLAKGAGGKDVVSVFQVVDLAGAERGNRTKATSEQQKEANSINTSLMQLFRCLQGMKKKSTGEGREENNLIIPFRESKLTHLLMPFLNKASLAGAAMLACVNPQGDDYDETISVLGNASMACKIKEISDVGRVGSTAAATQRASAGEVVTASEVGAKKRRAEGSAGVAPAPQAHKRGSTAATAKTSVSTSNLLESELNNHSTNHQTHNHKNSDTEGSNVHLYNDIKNLRAEISRLKAENQTLIVDQVKRETEIRSQVSEEMAKRSNYLLEQIQELQEQLYSKASKIDDVTKSCKKARKRQIDLANESASRDLQEAEEELERVKTQYEAEIATISAEKAQIESELAQWKARAESLSTLNHSLELANTQFGAEKGLYPYVEALGTAVVVKDSKDETESGKSPLPAPLERQRSSRSPLAPVGNSPLNPILRSASPMKGKDVAAAKRSVSPMKEASNKRRSKDNSPQRNSKKHRKSADENGDVAEEAAADKAGPGHAGTYLKKLRSHFIRG